jgi:hypothetical protein
VLRESESVALSDDHPTVEGTAVSSSTTGLENALSTARASDDFASLLRANSSNSNLLCWSLPWWVWRRAPRGRRRAPIRRTSGIRRRRFCRSRRSHVRVFALLSVRPEMENPVPAIDTVTRSMRVVQSVL